MQLLRLGAQLVLLFASLALAQLSGTVGPLTTIAEKKDVLGYVTC